MLGWIRTHPYLLVRNSLCGKRKQLEAALNHSYWKLYLFPQGSDFCAKVFSLVAYVLCARDGAPAERPARRKAELPEFQLFPLATKLHHVTYNLRQSTPFEGGEVSPHRDPGERFMGLKIYKHVFKITCLSFFSSSLKTNKIKSFCFKSSEMTGLMKMGTVIF